MSKKKNCGIACKDNKLINYKGKIIPINITDS